MAEEFTPQELAKYANQCFVSPGKLAAKHFPALPVDLVALLMLSWLTV
jgi:hypothetical protein